MYQDENTTWQAKLNSAMPFDPLLNCLIFITKHFDKPSSVQTLTSGLPLVDSKLDPKLFVRAAERAQLSARVIRYDINELNNKLLPAVVLVDNHNAWVITAINEDGSYQVIQPEAGDGTHTIQPDEMQEHYSGYAIFVKPKYRFDERADHTKTAPSKGWFWRVIKRSMGIYSEVLVASFLINLFALASPLFVMNVYDRVVPNEATHTLWVLAIGVTIAFSFDFIMRNLRGYFLTVAGKHVDIRLSRDVFERILGLELGVRPNSVGQLVNTVQAFDSFREFITSATIAALVDIPFTLLFLSVIAMIGGSLVLVPIALIPIILIVSALIQIPLTRYVKESFKHSAEKQAVLIESLGCAETIKGLRVEGPMQRRWEAIITNASRLQTKIQVLTNLGSNFSTFAQMMSTVGIVIFGVYKITAGELTMGALIACTILTGRALAPISQIAGLIARYQQAKTGLDAVHSLMQMPVERPPEASFLHRPDIKGSIAFSGVSFSYPSEKVFALQNVNFSIKSGEKIGLIGRTGSGKSTIEKMILKFYPPNEGSILIDGTELSQIDPADMRYYVGYVPQDVVLFHGSIKQNIIAGAPYVDDETILRAAILSGTMQFVESHPDGFDRQVGERGLLLSGGQRQAIALARALLLDPPILVFDEPCNAMDDTSTNAFINQLKTVLPNKTLILVTHKASLLKLVDRLIVMDQGRVVSDGAKDQVIEQLQQGKVKVKHHG